MKLRMHTATRRDVRQAVRWYDMRSDRAGDEFLQEVNAAIERIAETPTHFHFSHDNVRRCNLHQFPYHILFEIHLVEVHIIAIKHHRKHPSYGLKRRAKG